MAKSVSELWQLATAWIVRFWQTSRARAAGYLTNRNNYLLILFVVYVLLIPCFAGVYAGLYSADPRRFAFNQDIARAQQQIVKASTQQEIEHGKRLVEQLRHLSTYLAESKTPNLQFPKWLESYRIKIYADQFHYECTARMIGSTPEAGPQAIPILIIRTTNGQEIETFDLPGGLQCPAGLEEAKPFSINLVGAFEQDLAQTQRRFESLADEYPEVWSYWDFVYFSTVTQTTVGYGDIVPNSTSVRAIVVVQLIMGTGLLVVGLNLVLSGKNEADKPDPTA
ncbi:MAG TPA: potassium channel family protein [Pyrinomonadaceae bacterium]|nr:potassium channel family protein [Pyrinomonadaceae bacterium]